MVQGYLCKRLLGMWNLYIMNKALKNSVASWKQNMATGPWLCQTEDYQATSSIIQMVSTSIQRLYRIRLHIYIKCIRNKHLQWGLKWFATECKPTTTCWSHLIIWPGGWGNITVKTWQVSISNWWTQLICRIYTVLQNVWKGLPICAIYWMLQI